MIRLALILMLLAGPGLTQVRVDPERSAVADGWWRLNITLGLSELTPFQVFTVNNPPRLVVGLQDTVWNGSQEGVLEPGRATALRFGPYRDGWSRLVIDLAEPLEVTSAGMAAEGEETTLRIVMRRTSAEAFAVSARMPDVPPAPAAPPVEDGVFTVVLDPGHGGIDPGADRGGVQEADLMLTLGQEVAAALSGIEGLSVILTRDDDSFVPLAGRVSFARAQGADLLISLHADALEVDEAQGASVYTLALRGSDVAARRMVERHERGDLLGGVDLSGQGDRIANVLMDMARTETGPRGRNFADMLVAQMRERGVRLNARPRREGQFAVLAAADFPAVLVEAGFLSNAEDRARLTDPARRAPLVQAIAEAVQAFAN